MDSRTTTKAKDVIADKKGHNNHQINYHKQTELLFVTESLGFEVDWSWRIAERGERGDTDCCWCEADGLFGVYWSWRLPENIMAMNKDRMMKVRNSSLLPKYL